MHYRRLTFEGREFRLYFDGMRVTEVFRFDQKSGYGSRAVTYPTHTEEVQLELEHARKIWEVARAIDQVRSATPEYIKNLRPTAEQAKTEWPRKEDYQRKIHAPENGVDQ